MLTQHRRTFLLGLAALPSGIANAAGAMRVGCQTRAYGSPLPEPAKFFAALDGLKRAGYDGFETNYRSLEWAFADLVPARKRLAAAGVEMIGLHVGAGLYEPEKAAEESELVRRIAQGVRALGGKHLVLSGRQLPHAPNGRPDRDALDRKAKNLEKLGAVCNGLGVRLSYHNHTSEVQHGAEEIRYLLERTDPAVVSLLFDVGHVLHGEIDAAAFVREHASRLAGLHVRDVKGGEEVLIGTGTVDFRALGRALRDAGWSGWVIVEVNKRDDLASDDLVLRARKHLRQTMEI